MSQSKAEMLLDIGKEELQAKLVERSLASAKEDLQKLKQAKVVMENGATDLGTSMSGEYLSLTVVNGQNRGQHAQKQNDHWNTIQSELSKAKGKVDDALVDIADAIRDKQNQIASLTAELKAKQKSISAKKEAYNKKD